MMCDIINETEITQPKLCNNFSVTFLNSATWIDDNGVKTPHQLDSLSKHITRINMPINTFGNPSPPIHLEMLFLDDEENQAAKPVSIMGETGEEFFIIIQKHNLKNKVVEQIHFTGCRIVKVFYNEPLSNDNPLCIARPITKTAKIAFKTMNEVFC